MNIAVNTRLLLKGKLEGIGWFAYEVLERLVQQHPEHHFYFLFDRPFDSEFIFGSNVTGIYAGPPARHPVLWYWWFELTLPRLLRKIKADVFISPEGYLPLNLRLPKLAVMHDIAYEHYPETVPLMVRLYYKFFMPRFAREAKILATVSEYSKSDIVRTYSVPAHKVRVVYNGCNDAYHPVSIAEQDKIREGLTGGKPYFIFVGGLYPRKNISRLMQAFSKFKESDTSEAMLVLVGRKAYRSGELEALQASLPYGKDIIFTGRVEDAYELNCIISGSIAMTYVSLFEGFGIPCLEAMRCGTAVIASDTSSLPEVCGDAALYVDPLSVDSIAAAMERIVHVKGLREDLLRKGAVQAQKFSWQHTAELMWSCVEELLKN